MTETAEINERTPRRLHAARCCSVTPPCLHWNEDIEAIVCTECERIYAPIVLDVEHIDRDAIIRALMATRGVRHRAGELLGIDRHAMRRRIAKHKITYGKSDLVNPYASHGPTAAEVVA